MDQTAVVNLLVACVVLLTLAILLFLIAGIVLTIQGRRLSKRVNAMLDQVSPLVETAKTTMAELRPRIDDTIVQVQSIAADVKNLTGEAKTALDKANNILSQGQDQAHEIGGLVKESVERARLQIDRVEATLGATLERYDEVSETLRVAMLRPIREINGIFAGVQGALASLFRSHRTNVSEATQDDEMFI